jgi:hypothetical protein
MWTGCLLGIFGLDIAWRGMYGRWICAMDMFATDDSGHLTMVMIMTFYSVLLHTVAYTILMHRHSNITTLVVVKLAMIHHLWFGREATSRRCRVVALLICVVPDGA